MPLMAFWHRERFKKIEPILARELRDSPFDIIWVEHGFNIAITRELIECGTPGAILVANTHNVEFELAMQFAKSGEVESSLIDSEAQARSLYRAESEAFRLADLIVVCSTTDKDIACKAVPTGNYVVAENGVDIEYFKRRTTFVQGGLPVLLFTGLFTYRPNFDAAKYFVDEILPLIQDSRQVEVVFAGRNAATALAEVVRDRENVRCVSDPEDMRPQFGRASVFVAPLRLGGGTRLKILEAMAMECPVVSTSIGAEGMPYENGRHLLIADNPRSIADATLRILEDSKLRDSLVNNAASLVRNEFDWSTVTRKVIDHLGQMLTVRASS
jgi:glycosyltransferase involved in cell wall biosynthesis